VFETRVLSENTFRSDATGVE